MSERIHVLAQQLFGKTSVEECDLQEIRDLAESYPYFAPAQFLLLGKLKQESSPDYPAQLQKAVLYYQNPLEFEYFISSDKFYTEVDFTELPSPQTDLPEQKEMGYPAEEAEAAVGETESEEKKEHPVIEEKAAGILSEVHQQEKRDAETDQVEAIEETQISHPEPVTGNWQAASSPESSISVEPEPVLTFEPFHTVDYFASQGIKLSQEEVPRDRFGKQLKSFTEWLKTMKRLPAPETTSVIDASIEKNVQHLADDSVHESDVFTEAMAEVWLKQGNTPKALEVYKKLSLLNPSKRAYFAAKIENLKRS
jgi:hypothetical protein